VLVFEMVCEGAISGGRGCAGPGRAGAVGPAGIFWGGGGGGVGFGPTAQIQRERVSEG
jgi:hypothetical protein